MITDDQKERVFRVFKMALEVLKDEKIYPRSFVGKIILNCNNGGVTAIDTTDSIRLKQ